MKSKTLQLINQYHRILREQGEMPDMGAEQPQGQPQDVQNVVQPEPSDETVPMTSEGENTLISNLVDAALFKPSPQQEDELLDMQSAIQMKKVRNLRQDVLPTVVSMISSISQDRDMKPMLNQLD